LWLLFLLLLLPLLQSEKCSTVDLAWLSSGDIFVLLFFRIIAGSSCFQGFFNHPEMQIIAKHFCIYHLNALGQHERAQTLPNG